MLTTTLNEIKANQPCVDGWKKLLEHLGKSKADSEPLGFDVILKSNGLNDALWALRTLENEQLKQAKLFICDIAEIALKYVPKGENRPSEAIAMSRKFIKGGCSLEELRKARRDAADANAAYAYATSAAAVAAAATGYAAAYAYDAVDALIVVAYAAAYEDTEEEQEKMFIEFINRA